MLTFTDFIFHWKQILIITLFLLIMLTTSSIFTLPIVGINLIVYFVIIGIISIWTTFKSIQTFLQQTKPFNLEPYIKLVKNKPNKSELSRDLSCIGKLTTDIDQNFIKSWFTYISNDPTFSDESRIVLQDVLRKILNVELSIENDLVVHAILNVYLKHLKEFRRSLKRKLKHGGNISELYRFSHICSNSTASKEHFLHQLTINLLNHFINWELSNSLPCRVLLGTIAKTVTNYALKLLSNPDFLYYFILYLSLSDAKRDEMKLKNYNRIKLRNLPSDYDTSDANKSETVSGNQVEQVDSVDSVDFSSKPNEVIVKSTNKNDLLKTLSPAKSPKKKKKKLAKKYEEIKNEDVKVYEPKSSCKTWYDSFDLESVTLGQDTLDMLNAADSSSDNKTHEKNVWEYGTECLKEELSSPVAAAKSLLDEVKHMTSIEGIKTSIKPISDVTVHTLHNLQEHTVNNVVKDVSQVTTSALHKIGGLQDEAAGVVEGLWDFGRTRIRKGLRLTGLQDNVVDDTTNPTSTITKPVDIPKVSTGNNKHYLSANKKNIVKWPHVESQEKVSSANDNNETVWINPLQENDKFLDNNVLKTDVTVPTILTHSHESSPDPEYEETADLATSIAKLRSLLEQKSSESNMSTPAVSPMPSEEFSSKILLDNEIEAFQDQSDGVMPNFYKFCAKTATGVIKNIKTALPGNATDYDVFDNTNKWMFVKAQSNDDDLFVRMNKLLSERKVFCTIDTAYEAIDSLVPLQPIDDNLYSSNSIQFEDELDDFEVKLPITKTLLDILCELLADTKSTPFKQEPVIKSILLLFGNYIEDNVKLKFDYSINYLCTNAEIPSKSKINTLELDVEEYIEDVLTGIPNYIRYILGEDVLKQVLSLFIRSLQIQKINQDLLMQIFAIISMKLIEGSKHMSPV